VAVIARSDSDEAIQTASAVGLWISSAYALWASADRSLALAMTWREPRECIPAMRKLPVVHIFSCVVGQITTMLPRIPPPIKRGASRSSRTLEAGCDGRGVL
jgi:hypothetical protein